MINKITERERFGEVKKTFRLEGTDYERVMDAMDDLFCENKGNTHGVDSMIYNTGNDIFVSADYSKNDQNKGEGVIVDFHFYTDNSDERESILSVLREKFRTENPFLCYKATTTLTELVDEE